VNRHEPSSLADYYDLFDAKFNDTIEIDNGIVYYQNLPYSGRFITKHKNGNVQVNGYYIDGLKEYAWTEYYENHQKKKYTNYKKGLKQGFSVKWYRYAEDFGSYLDGEKHGLWYEYIGNREKPKRRLYEHGGRQFTTYPLVNNLILITIFAFCFFSFFV